MKILLIEDDFKTREALRLVLEKKGYEVIARENGPDGFTAATDPSLDLILLDLMLPGRDGWSILMNIRAQGVHTPLIVISALDALEHRVKALTHGADDYLTKPFATAELAARIAIVSKRGKLIGSDLLETDDLKLDPKRNDVTRAGQRIDLTVREYALLALLVRNRGNVLSRTFIAEQVWDMSFDADSNVVDVNVRRLRAKIDDPFPKKLIHTVRGRGYVIR